MATVTIEQILKRRVFTANDLGFDNSPKFYFASFIGEIEELEGEYLKLDEPDYPCWGMSIMVICTSPTIRQSASLINKMCIGKPWLLVEWIIDAGKMIEHVSHGTRHKDYGVSFDVKYSNLGNDYYQELAKKYYEGIQRGESN